MNYYLNRFAVREQLIFTSPSPKIGIVIVIPCCNEPDLMVSLQAILNCDLPDCDVEVITVINASETAADEILQQNNKTLTQALKWSRENQQKQLKFYFLEENTLPKKDAGVGLARKIGMDEAVRRFEVIKRPDGIILCFDADAKCDTNYLVEVEKHFKKHPKSPACSIHYEHPISGNEFSEELYKGIVQYELHLRVYKNGLKYAGLPFAFHTIGSSMAVRNAVYQKQNGMNKRKAGEDFYFLQKLIPLGGFTEIKSTKVIPSPRVSDRVPFGTGRAIKDWLFDDKQEMLSYNLKSYMDLKLFCNQLPMLYDNEISIPVSVQSYFNTINFDENLFKIKANSTSVNHFAKLFFNWFNAFKVLKYMHFSRDNFYPDVPVFDVANELLLLLNQKEKDRIEQLLFEYRKLDLK